jgi:peptidoglycan/LPS O-acetylase OafA/YrhL
MICVALLIFVGAGFLRMGGRDFVSSFLAIVRTLSWVALGRAICWASPPRWVSTVGSRSMGIYLIHIVFTVSLPQLLQVTGFKLTGSSQTLGIAVCAFLLSFFMVERLRRLHVPGM